MTFFDFPAIVNLPFISNVFPLVVEKDLDSNFNSLFFLTSKKSSDLRCLSRLLLPVSIEFALILALSFASLINFLGLSASKINGPNGASTATQPRTIFKQ